MLLRAALALLLLQPAAVRTLTASPLTVSAELAGPSTAEPVRGTVHFTSQAAASGGGAAKTLDLSLPVPGRASVELDPAVSSWQVQPSAPGLYCPERVLLRPEPGAPPLALVCYATAHVVARVVSPADARPPAELVARFQPVPHRAGVQPVPEGAAACPVRGGRWACDVPAGLADLRLKGEGLIPLYFWGVDLRAAASKDLGTLRLRRGASVAGWLVTETGQPAAAGSRVELAVQSAAQPWLQADGGRRLGVLASAARANDRGFFQLEGIRPGSYVLTASGPGYAPVRRAPIVVHEGLQSEILEPLVLGPPLRLAVLLDPPLDPYGQPWRLELTERDALVAAPHRGRATPEGRWEQAGLAPGTYDLMVTGSGLLQGSRWVDQQLVLSRDSEPVEITVPVVEVDGTVTLGREPLAATAWFGGRHGATRVRFDADAKGRFHGFLPRTGSWLVDAAEPKLAASLPAVEVSVPSGQRQATVTLAVPNTLVSGLVVDPQGNPVAAATVSATAVTAHQGAVTQV
jgi:hypothetical protein